jgi:site-specific DNA-methyltransferase (adenine-specific)
MNIQLHHGDCLEVMATLPDNSVDAVITDPPYCSGGVSEASRVSAIGQGLRSENLGRFGWFVGDNMTTAGLVWVLRHVAIECQRIVKPSGSVMMFCDWRMLHTLVPALESAGLRYQGLVVWDKGHFGMGNGFRCQHEMIMHFTCGKPQYYSKSFGNVLQAKRVNANDRQHQTQKPIELLSPLLKVGTPKGGIVLDPFMGSGSTGVAAMMENRKLHRHRKRRGLFQDSNSAYRRRANGQLRSTAGGEAVN